MKRKLLILLLAIVSAFACALCLSACDGEDTHEHSYGEWKTALAPTCTAEGKKERECACGDKQTEAINPLGHNFENYVSDDNATCNKNCTETATCTRCTQTDSREIDGTTVNHLFIIYKSNGNATCTADGTKTAVCSYYGCTATDTITEADSALGHNFVNYVPDDNATCTNNCTETATCTRCTQTDSREIEDTALGHIYEDFVCKRCGSNHPDKPTEGLEYSYSTEPGIVGEEKPYYVSGIGTAVNESRINIPALHNNRPVIGISSSAFENCSNITSVTIPDSVITIGDRAFRGCSNLTSVTIPDSVTTIGRDAFRGCSSLTSIAIPDSVTSIGTWAFYNCSSITSIVIPESVSFIGDSAFRNCLRLVEVYNLTAFDLTKGATDNGYLGRYALNIYTSLESESKLTVTDEGYIFCEDDTTAYLVGYKGTETKLTLPTSFKDGNYEINEYVFYDCSNIISVTIPDGVTAIGKSAFAICTELKSIAISISVTSISDTAFGNCGSLTEINFDGTIDQWNSIQMSNTWNLNTVDYTVHCSDGKLDENGNEIVE